jgi:hypothetical protein
MTVAGIVFGAYISICFAIRREDRAHTLPYDPPNFTAQTARTLVGIDSSRWD